MPTVHASDGSRNSSAKKERKLDKKKFQPSAVSQNLGQFGKMEGWN